METMGDMSGWLGKKVYIRTRNGRPYAGIITDVDQDSKPVIFITILDKFDQTVRFMHSEIAELKEER